MKCAPAMPGGGADTEVPLQRKASVVSTSIIPFQFQDREVRVVDVEGEPWFVASDVAKILGYRDAEKMTRRLDAEDRGTRSVGTPSGDQQMTIISEPGLYVAVLGSQVQGAREFKRWVTREVLPAIRRTGQYQAEAPVALPGRRELAQMVLEAEDRADREALARARVEYTLEQQQPVMDYHERFVAATEDIVTIDNFASQYGTTGPKVRSLMKEKGVAIRRQVGARWSRSKQAMEDEYEWRPRQGVLSSDWFVLRPQHNAPRLHNGQVRQTLYVLQFHVQDLAGRLGLNAPALDVESRGDAA